MYIKAMPKAEREGFWAFVLFVAPLVTGLVIFTVIPIVWGLLLSVNEARGTVALRHFVGLQNYILLFQNEAFLNSLKTILIYGLFIVPGTIAFSLGLAVLVTNTRKGQGFFRTVFFMPMACSYVVASLIWRMSLFNGMRFGLVNSLIRLIGVAPVAWTNTSPEVWFPLVTVRLWLQVGFYMIIYIAGIQEIPEELYEAARVDGAERGWVVFRHITFPLLRNTTLFVLFINIVNIFMAFDEFYNILGGTASSTFNLRLARPPLVYLYTTSFTAQDFGVGSAGAFIIAFCIVISTMLQGRFIGLGRGVR